MQLPVVRRLASLPRADHLRPSRQPRYGSTSSPNRRVSPAGATYRADPQGCQNGLVADHFEDYRIEPRSGQVVVSSAFAPASSAMSRIAY